MSKIQRQEMEMFRKFCGCNVCDCELSQSIYHEGCHTYGLFDQENDATNSTESGNYDESFGPKIKGRNTLLIDQEELDFIHLTS